ncbi:MAG TPA: FAD-dependent oxidoreductase [Acidimicrobiales bacterium]|nr:FAD-dependent oxidoreductase [Acidimicrobiales bacterium]
MTPRGRVVVVGSGAAGLAAALGASAGGSDVVVLERDETVGGTTALSGGVVWLPDNDVMKAAGLDDSASEACRYLGRLATGEVDAGLMVAFASDAGRVGREIEARTPLRWELLEHWPDYHGELPGAVSGGRSLWPRTLTLPAAVETRVHRAPDQPRAAGSGSAHNDGVVFRGPVRGRALVGALLAGVGDAGIEVRTGARVTGLAREGDRVMGVQVGGDVVEGRVVLACGGFQHDPGLAGAHLRGAPVAAMGTPGCDGDGLRMALSVGVVLGNMTEGWWMPALHVPGEELDGVPYYRPLHSERAYPGAIMVDRTGRRFVDEAQNYGDVGRAIGLLASGAPGPAEPPCWLVFDGACRRRYPVGPLYPDDPDPPWLRRADDLATLAAAIGVEAGTLRTTVSTFNDGARRGEDPEFGRGSLPYDRWIGDQRASHPTLAPLDEAPFYAVAVHRGCMGTKGGPRTDDRGRVLSSDGAVVAGLYAAGNVAANPFGTATPAGGGTLGPALVFGFRAGEAAAGDR